MGRRRRPRLEMRIPDVTIRALGVELPCVAVAARTLSGLQLATAPYMEGFNVAIAIDDLDDHGRSLAELLLAKVVASDHGTVLLADEVRMLLVHPWYLPPDSGSPGDRAPLHPSPTSG